MVVQLSAPPADLADAFVAVAHRVVWCTVATVDRRGRPRSRLMHPVWAWEDGRLGAWVTARPTPLKRAHLEHAPFVSCSYWDPAHDIAVAECAARWVTDLAELEYGWVVCRETPAPAGHDPAVIWPDGPSSPDAGMLRLEPWRLRVGLAAELATGVPPRSWRAA